MKREARSSPPRVERSTSIHGKAPSRDSMVAVASAAVATKGAVAEAVAEAVIFLRGGAGSGPLTQTV